MISQYFFEDVVGNTVSVDGERYRTMITEFLLPQINELGLESMWFQQDGATAHTARATMDILRPAFPGRLISRFSDLQWPARLPDLTAPDFSLWGFLKSRFYVNKSQTLAALKENIKEKVANLSPEVLRKVIKNVLKRAQMCINSGGGHLQILFSRLNQKKFKGSNKHYPQTKPICFIYKKSYSPRKSGDYFWATLNI